MRNFSTLFTFLLCLTFSYTAQSQVFQDDFEGSGTITNWYGDDCGMNINLANPFTEGENTSATVLEYNDTGGQYANVRFEQETKFDLTTNNTFSLKIYVPSSGLTGDQNHQVSLKLQDGDLNETWTTQSEIVKPITLNEWQTVTFDFQNDNFYNLDPSSLPPVERTDFNRVVIQVNGENNNDFVLAYIDDVQHFNTFTEVPVFDNLVWSDEFDDTDINPQNWTYDLGANGWGNQELQNYTSNSDNSYVANGNLMIVAKEQGTGYTSARMKSIGLQEFQYGRIDVRAILPSGQGIWPAIWMLGHDFGSVGWPACGEIDIMELIGSSPNAVHGTIHYGANFSQHDFQGSSSYLPLSQSFNDEFHVFSIEWDENGITWYVDDVEFYSVDNNVTGTQPYPFDDEFFFIMNVAVGGQWPGYPDATTTFPQFMAVDYVRVFQ